MTKAELAEFRSTRKAHYIGGIGKVDDIPRYRYLENAVEIFVGSLRNEEERRVMELLYLQMRSGVAAAMLMHYSERQIQRIRARVLERLE